MVFNANVELDTNIHNTPPFHLKNLILDCYSNVFQSLIISTNYSMHFIYLSCAIHNNGVCSSSFKCNHLTSLLLLIDILWKLSNIPTRGYYGQIRLLVAHKMFHSFSALIQPTHFRSTPSALIFENNSGNPNTDIWASWWDFSAGCQVLRLDISWKIAFYILYHWT